jgi:hypothetical protein
LKADAGSRDAAREMYQRLYETSDDKTVKEMVVAQLLRLDWLDDREVIIRALDEFRNRSGRCPTSWRELLPFFSGAPLQIDIANGTPFDPSGVAYRLINDGCGVDLGEGSKVAR